MASGSVCAAQSEAALCWLKKEKEFAFYNYKNHYGFRTGKLTLGQESTVRRG